MSRGTVAVLGASGQVGRFAVPMLAHWGWSVLALSRHERPDRVPELPGVEWHRFEREVTARPGGVQALLSAGPLRLATDMLRQCPSIRDVVVVSSSSIHSKPDSADDAEREVIAELLRQEQHILALCRERQAACTILRPTLVYGAGLDHNLTRLVRWIQRRGWLPLARGANGLRQPLHAADLAEACVRALEAQPGEPLVSELCGGSTVAYRTMVEGLFAATGRPVRILAVPVGLLCASVALAARTPWLRGANPEMVRRQDRDLVFDDRLAREKLQVQPRPFEPRLEDFTEPSPSLLRSIHQQGPLRADPRMAASGTQAAIGPGASRP